jgi:hypothetical protein
MPFEIRVQDGYFFMRLFGVVVEQDLRGAAEEMAKLEALPGQPLDRMMDMSDVVELSFGFPAVLSAATTRTQAPLRAKVKSAVVAQRPLHVGFARMFQTLNENPNIELRIFATLEEAKGWLAED